jgi:hypothetical protein
MQRLLKLIFGALVCCFRARRDLLLENLALRQQLAVLDAARSQDSPMATDFSGLRCVVSGRDGERR